MMVRLLALLSAALLFVLAAVPASASGDQNNGGNHNGGNGSYLALGDSVAFGYNAQFTLDGRAINPHVLVGYPEIVANGLDLRAVNASCPGETTGGFISRTAALDYLCLPYAAVYPLHVNYSTSQLDFAIHYLSTHHNVHLVTMTIGANDAFKVASACGGTATTCFFNAIPGILAGINSNLRYIYGQIRNVAHYHGALVTLTYYSAMGYDPANAGGTQLLNGPIIDATVAFGGIVASGFDAFKGPALAAGGSPCAAGLLLPAAPPGTPGCDVHPSPAGRDLLAAAVVKAIADSCPAQDADECLSGDGD